MIDEGNRLLAMIEDLEQGISCWDFPKKYFRIPRFKGTDGLLSGIERMIDDAIKAVLAGRRSATKCHITIQQPVNAVFFWM